MRRILNDGLECNYQLQSTYFSVNVAFNDFDDVKQRFYEDIIK